MLRINLLGAAVVEVDGAPLAVDTRKAVALAAYLALEGGAHSRESLASFLWPDYEPERGRAALRRTLSTLRTGLGDGGLAVGRDTVALDAAGFELDIQEFRVLASRDDPASLARAIDLYRGPFMAGFALRDSVPFDDWQSFNTNTLARELATVLDRAADASAARGEWPRALEHARRRLALDELQEPAHRRLMRLYAESGDRGAALEQYRVCVRVLHRELGVAPLAETTALYHAIREGAIEAPPPAPGPALPAEPETYPFVGRAREIRAMRDAYDSVGPHGRLVAVEGEIGIGKTRLAEELLGWARGRGSTAIGIRCFEDERGLAFATVLGLLRAALRDGDREAVEDAAAAEAARLLPELGTPPTRSLDDPGAQARFVEGVAQTLLAATGGERPAVVLVDDVHWADAPSLEVLTYLAHRLRDRPVLLILTWRSEETPTGHPARRALAGAARDGLGSGIVLERLARADVGELAAAAGADRDLADRLFAETQGLPFFVVEYLDALGDQQPPWPMPAGVRELLEARLAAASEIAGQVAAAAAVIGHPSDLDLLRDVSGRAEEETVSALEELGERGILVDVETGFDFKHEQARKVAYERTSTGRRRLLHRRAADALAASARGTALAGVVAQHFQLAGRSAEAAEWFLLAGEHARGLYANAEALAFFGDALALGYPDGARLHSAIGDLQTLAGDYDGALASYEAAAANASGEQLPGVEHQIGLVHHRRGEWELADGSFEAAFEAVADDALRARILADRSLNAHRRGRDEEARTLAHESLELGEQAGDPQALAQAHNLLGILAAGAGDRAEARAQLERSLALAETGDPAARSAALNNLALVYRADGDLDRALELAEEALALGFEVGDRHRIAALENNAADLLHAAGRHDEAMERLKAAVAGFSAVGQDGAMEPEIWKLVDW